MLMGPEPGGVLRHHRAAPDLHRRRCARGDLRRTAVFELGEALVPPRMESRPAGSGQLEQLAMEARVLEADHDATTS